MKSIYTLAQSRTEKTVKPAVIVVGKGSEMLDSEFAKKKAKQKTINQTLCLAMVDEAKHQKKEYLVKQIWNTFHCIGNVTFSDGKIYGKYCKNRFCLICSNIRKAEEIKKYKPVLENWENPYLVTLTVKSCSRLRLKATINAMYKAFRNIHDKQRKRGERNGSFRLMGIRSLECNFNPLKSTYNPHFHIIVPTKETAEFLIDEWLKRVGKENAFYKGQDMRRIKNLDSDLIEVIKYGVKIFTDPEMKKTKVRNRAKIYAKAQLNILDAFHGHRIFDRFGFNLPKEEKTINTPKIVTNFEKYHFDLQRYNWVNDETNETLSDYLPDFDLITILKCRIDKEKE